MREHFRTTYQWLCKVASGEVESWHGSLEKIKKELQAQEDLNGSFSRCGLRIRPKMDKSTASPTAPMRPKNDKSCARVEFRVFFEKNMVCVCFLRI